LDQRRTSPSTSVSSWRRGAGCSRGTPRACCARVSGPGSYSSRAPDARTEALRGRGRPTRPLPVVRGGRERGGASESQARRGSGTAVERGAAGRCSGCAGCRGAGNVVRTVAGLARGYDGRCADRVSVFRGGGTAGKAPDVDGVTAGK